MSQKKRKYQDKCLDFGFTYLIEDDLQIPQCVVCMKTFLNSTMKPASLKQHLAIAHPSMMSRNCSFFESKLSSLKRQKLHQTGMLWRTNKAAVHASYAIALHVAITKKPHNIGETLLKPCILESVKLVLGEKASQTMKQISLSNDTIKSRIHEMSDNIKSKVLSKIDSSPVFALQLDESTDIFNLSQLLVYIRYVADERINEQFLFCQPLETTSKAVDVFQMLIDFFHKTELSWSKLVGVCTDGAPAMIGANSGLISLVKQKNPAIQGTHCMIHKAALVSKTIPKRLHERMSVVIKVVNYVKSSALNTRLFSKLCKDMDADHTALLYQTQVRWLSKGNILSRIFELREVKLFLVAKQKHDLLLAFGGDGFSTYLAYLADIFEALNQLNKKLQGPGTNTIVHSDAINAFVVKLNLWRQRAKNNDFASFHRLTVITGDDFNKNLKEDIISHLRNLQDEFEQYFPEINTGSILMKVARNPFIHKVEDVPEAIQEEFTELTNNSIAKDEFHSCKLEEFWVKMQHCYPRIGIQALNILVPFSSTYLCEYGFSALLTIKPKARNRLHVQSDIRCALSTTLPGIEKLVAKKQGHPSH